MYQKGSRFYADWRDEDGVRHRKAFADAEAATTHEEAMKVASKKHGCSHNPGGI